jgi:predicted transposase/invertase (TIGR01784 family)
VKTDTIFYRLFQSFPGIFFELIDSSPQQANTYQFASVEVKQLAFRIDGVFLPTVNAPHQPIYFLEVQFQPDGKFYSRFFSEIFLYLDKTELNNNWRGVVIFSSRNVDTSNTERYTELLESRRVTRIYLDELAVDSSESVGIASIKLIVANEEAAIEQGRSLIAKIRSESEDEFQERELLELIKAILIYKLPETNRREIEAMFSLSDLKNTRVYQEALEEGREEGRQEGRQEGNLQGKLASVPLMLSLGATVEQIAEALGLDVEQVRQVAQQQADRDR